MQPYRHILVPTDFSPGAERACAAAGMLATALDARITLLHVVDVAVPPFADDAGVEPPDFVAPALEAARAALERAQGRTPRCTATRAVVRLRSTASEILEAASTYGADLIVMATHGHAPSLCDFIGHTTQKVVRKSSLPVLTVHPAGAAVLTEAAISSAPVAQATEARDPSR